MARHEMWQDELQAWIVAKDSISITELYRNIESSGHPPLWYLGLHFLSQITPNPVIMQILHLLIATASFSVFLFCSPFSLVQKVLYGFGYYSLFEYGIISRNYSIGILFLYLACSWFARREQHYGKIAIFLVLAAHTNAYALMLSFAFQTIIFAEVFLYKPWLFKRWNFWLGMSIYTVGLAVAMYHIIPPGYEILDPVDTANSEPKYSLFLLVYDFGRTILQILRSYLNIPDLGQFNFWNTNLFIDNNILRQNVLIFNVGLNELAALFISIGLFLFFCLALASRPIALLLYVLGNIELGLFNWLIRFGSLRHYGHLFILLLLSLWIASYLPEQKTYLSIKNENRQGIWRLYSRKLAAYLRDKIDIFKQLNFLNFNFKQAKKLLTVILIMQLLGGMFAIYMDFMYPFSNNKNVATYIQKNQLEQMPIAGMRTFMMSPITLWLDRPIYFVEFEEYSTFSLWHSRRKTYNPNITQLSVLQKLNLKFFEQENHEQILLILDTPLTSYYSALKIEQIASFSGAIFKEDQYYLYLIQPQPVNSAL